MPHQGVRQSVKHDGSSFQTEFITKEIKAVLQTTHREAHVFNGFDHLTSWFIRLRQNALRLAAGMICLRVKLRLDMMEQFRLIHHRFRWGASFGILYAFPVSKYL